SKFKPINLVAHLVNKPSSSFFEIENSHELRKLHTNIMEEFEKIASYNVKSEAFYDKSIREHSLDWVRNFRKDAAFENYWPHITLLTSNPSKDRKTLKFIAKRLAICHLGDYNTCRKILVEVTLHS
ncbi:hypothetical protein BVY00_00300, partial [bacterium G20]